MVDSITLGLGVVILLVFLYMIKVVLDLQAAIQSSMRRVENQLGVLESTASSVTSDVAGLKRQLSDKVDRTFVEKRLSGLADLLRRPKKSRR
ncbi:MAG: hypothetical protein Q8P02_03105 [Candidatus Micrarchaeota archaeon]|nr:hypothetical protein [Candidatus Micrarchaeota archaeon]